MRNSTRVSAVAAGIALLAGGCSSGAADEPSSSASSAAASPTAAESPSVSATPTDEAATPTGTLATTPVECAELTLPAGLERAGASPDVMCAFESDTDYVSFAVGTNMAQSFDMAKSVEQSNSDGKTVIEPVSADGWTFGARWPDEGPFVRVQHWLVDGGGQVLLCKMGSDRGEAGIGDLAEVCEQAKSALYTS